MKTKKAMVIVLVLPLLAVTFAGKIANALEVSECKPMYDSCIDDIGFWAKLFGQTESRTLQCKNQYDKCRSTKAQP